MDIDQKALDVLDQCSRIRAYDLPGGSVQAKAGHQLVIAKALRESMAEALAAMADDVKRMHRRASPVGIGAHISVEAKKLFRQAEGNDHESP